MVNAQYDTKFCTFKSLHVIFFSIIFFFLKEAQRTSPSFAHPFLLPESPLLKLVLASF